MSRRFVVSAVRWGILIGMGMLVGALNLAAQPPADLPWPMFHHDLYHTGLSPLTGDMDTCYLMWSYTTTARDIVRSSPALGDIDGDGSLEVVVGSGDGKLYALHGQDGGLLWSYTTGDEVYSSPALGDIDGDGSPEVVFGSRDDNIYALNGEDGFLLWSYTTGGQIFSSPALGDIDGDGKLEVVVASDDGKVYALNGEDGTVLWSYTTGDWVWSSPALGDVDDDGKLEVVVGSNDDTVYALNGEDGTVLWSYAMGAWVAPSPALADVNGNGNLEVVIGSDDDNVYALNGQHGTVLWSYATGSALDSSPAVGDIDGDGNLEVVIGSWDRNVYALNGEDGSLLWSYATGGWVLSSPALGDVDGDGEVEAVIGSDDDTLYALNGEDGSLVWSYGTGGDIGSSPALGDIDGDGNLEVVVGSGDGKVYALDGGHEGKPDRDIDVSGTRSRNYLYTWGSDDAYESIREQESTGNPSRRYSYLEHKWEIYAGAGNQITFYVEAYHTDNLEGDHFVFAYSTDDANYTDMLTVTKTADDDECDSFLLPSSLSGQVYIRVKDTDRTPGNRVLDTIFIDYMFIESSTIPDNTPPVISNVVASGITSSSATITWDTDEYSNSVVRYDTDGGPEYDYVASSEDMVLEHSVPLSGLSPSTQYYYVVESTDAAGNTATSDEHSFTTTTGGDELHVSNIDVSLKHTGPFTRGAAEVTVVGADGSPVADATVGGHWRGLTSDSDQFTTGSDGVGSCDSDKLRDPVGWFIFTVDSVFKQGWAYNPDANEEDADSISVGGGGSATAGQGSLPHAFALCQNHPNPVSTSTTIPFAVPDARCQPVPSEVEGMPDARYVTLRIYDASGRLVRTLVDEPKEPGYYSVTWDGKDESTRAVSTGVYLYRLEAGEFAATRKMLVLR